mgnify:CR=1 FL=1
MKGQGAAKTSEKAFGRRGGLLHGLCGSAPPRANAPASIQLPHLEPHNTSAWAQYTIQVPNREALQEQLKQAGIPTAVHYPIPLNQQPAVADSSVSLPVGDKVARRVISLPMHPYLDTAALESIVQALMAHPRS